MLGLGAEFSRGEVWVLSLGAEFWVLSDIGLGPPPPIGGGDMTALPIA